MRKLIPSKISQQTIQSQPVNKLAAKMQASFSLIPKFLPFTSTGFLHCMAQPGKTELSKVILLLCNMTSAPLRVLWPETKPRVYLDEF